MYYNSERARREEVADSAAENGVQTPQDPGEDSLGQEAGSFVSDRCENEWTEPC